MLDTSKEDQNLDFEDDQLDDEETKSAESGNKSDEAETTADGSDNKSLMWYVYNYFKQHLLIRLFFPVCRCGCIFLAGWLAVCMCVCVCVGGVQFLLFIENR